MARSKSPAARKSSSASNDAHVQAGIAAGILVVLIVWNNGWDTNSANPQTGSWVNFFAGSGNAIHAQWPFTILATLHALNTAQSASGGFWLGSAVNNYFATFAAPIVAALFFGGGNLSGVYDANNAALAGASWFIVNNAIGGFNAWDEVKKVGGNALDQVLGAATLAFTLNAALASVGSVGAVSGWQDIIGVVYAGFQAAVIANAGNFFPLDKGFSFDGFDDVSDAAFTTVCIVAALNTFNLGGALNGISSQLGSDNALSAEFLVFANVMATFITGSGACPAIPNPIAKIQDTLYDVTGLQR